MHAGSDIDARPEVKLVGYLGNVNTIHHLHPQRLAWRTDSCEECKGPGGEDLSGGYYEAGGSYLKFSFPTAFTLTQLAWGVVEYRDGYEKVRLPDLLS